MDKKHEATIRQELLKQRAEISDEMQRHGGVQESGASSGLRDPEERAASLADAWLDDRIAADDENLLAKIELALQRLDEGKHDVCAECGGPIPIERLLAKPSASLCVACQAAKSG